MDNIFDDLKNKANDYSRKIAENKYTQSAAKIEDIKSSVTTDTKSIISVKNFNTLFELLLSIKDVNYCLLENNEKDKYVSDQKIHLCSTIDDNYDTFNFNKKILSKSLICANLQKKDNVLSLILFYNEYYKINIIFYNKSNNNLYKTGLKDYEKVFITYSKEWVIIEEKDMDATGTDTYSDINELHGILDIDLKTNNVYNQYLKAISNYKLPDLVEEAGKCDISLNKNNGKKKTKKELYDAINSIKL